ncbi:hypothetical protein FS837_009350 [Tulasnella sp. UAMH 9824]|nr:hypothetical protein FS837_009350 [Tulasnella sp. UAMH 9824]
MTSGGLASISGLSPTSTSQATLGSHVYRKRPSDLDLTDLSASTSSKRIKLESGSSSPVRYALSQKTNLDVKSEPVEPSYRSTPPRRSSTSSNSAPAPHRQLQQPHTAPSSSVMPKVEPGRDSTVKARMAALKKVTSLRQQKAAYERQVDMMFNSFPQPEYSQIDALLDAIERNKAEIEAQELIAYSTTSRTAHGGTSFTTRLPPVQVDSPPPIKLESANAVHAAFYPAPHQYQTPNPYTWGESNVTSLHQQLEDALDNDASPTRVQSLMAGIQHWDNGSSYSSSAAGPSQAVKSEPIPAIKWPAPRGSVYATPAVTKEDPYPSYGVAGPSSVAPPPAFAQLEDVKPKVDPYVKADTFEPLPTQSFEFLDESDDDDDGGPVPNQLNYGAPAYTGYAGYTRSGEALTDFLVSAGNAEIFEKDVTVHNSLQYLGLRDLSQNFHGMRIPLLAHQVLGVAWMAKKEVDPRKSGGIMADEMGLGKTVQTIATVCFNSPKPNRPKGTLIVAPVALLDQWRSEIESKTNRNFQVLIYHGSSKPKGQDAAKVLAQYDFVLTSYGTLSAEWPENDDFKARQKKKRKNAKKDDFIVVDSGDEGSSKKKKGKAKDVKIHSPLFETVWHRIVLDLHRLTDEAQNIRNRHTRISVAVTDLHATHRWCLTGTPLTNGTADAFGLLRFLAIRPWYEWKEFNQHVVLKEKKNADLATKRLQLIFRECLIRRKKDSTLEGRKLIELPPKDYYNPEYQFSEEELEIYNFLQARSRAIFNKFLRQGTVLKNYSQVLVLLLRLRQCCVHPALIGDYFLIAQSILGLISSFVAAQYEDAFLQKGEVREAGGDEENLYEELMRAEDIKGAEWVMEVRKKFLVDALERIEAEKREGGDALANQECPICLEPMTDGSVIPCKHVYCRGCINDLFEAPGQLQDGMNAVNENQRPCPQCRKPFVKEHAFLQRVFMPTDSELGLDTDDGEDAARRSKGKGKGKDRASRNFQTSSDDDHALHHSDGDEGYVSPSQRALKKGPRRSGRATKSFKYEAESDDSMDDFIVEDGETEAAKDAKRDAKMKQKARKGKGKMRVDSDDEYGSQAEEDDDEVVEIKKGDYLAKVGIAEPVRQPPMMAKFLPSTKMIAMMRLLEDIRDKYPDDKVMVVSQWTSALELCANYLDEKHFSYVRYEGSMNRTAREHAVRAFMDTTPDHVRVMLMSLKAGGVGLNLVRANWVISLDFAWSEAVEAQAFDRTHRLGQIKPVQIHRLCIANTVEGRVKALQAKKKQLADGSLGEGGAKLGRLSVRELAGRNPGQVTYFIYFLDYLHKLHPELGILAKAHLGHTPGYCKTPSEEHYGLPSQVDSAMETVRSLKQAYPHAKIVLVLQARPEETEAAFLLMPSLSNLATTPNGLKLAVLLEWPDQQLDVVKGMLRSPAAVTSALRMARDEMASVKDLEAPLLKKHSEKIHLYCASKDDWVGKEKEGVIAALGGPSERIVEDMDDTPHAFVITENPIVPLSRIITLAHVLERESVPHLNHDEAMQNLIMRDDSVEMEVDNAVEKLLTTIPSDETGSSLTAETPPESPRFWIEVPRLPTPIRATYRRTQDLLVDDEDPVEVVHKIKLEGKVFYYAKIRSGLFKKASCSLSRRRQPELITRALVSQGILRRE